MNYRDAQPADASAITRSQLAMALETEELRLDEEECSKGVSALFAKPALGRYFIAEEKGEIAGCLMTTFEWSDWRNGMVWWIQSVYVAPTFRRRGVYTGLYHHVQQLAANDSDVRGIRLYVDRRNLAAQEVYSRLGMNGEHYQLFEWMK